MHHDKRRIAKMRPNQNKAIVTGLIHEGGEARAQVVRDTHSNSLRDFIDENIEAGSHIITDSAGGYKNLWPKYRHKEVEHRHRQYVTLDGYTTNAIENFWAILKRGLKGTYISVEPFHLFRYVEETMFRFNSRKLKDGVRFLLACHGLFGKRMTYKALIGDHYDHSVRG